MHAALVPTKLLPLITRFGPGLVQERCWDHNSGVCQWPLVLQQKPKPVRAKNGKRVRGIHTVHRLASFETKQALCRSPCPRFLDSPDGHHQTDRASFAARSLAPLGSPQLAPQVSRKQTDQVPREPHENKELPQRRSNRIAAQRSP